MTGTPREPDGTELVTQLGEVMGGPEVPADPETEAVDMRRKLWNATRLGESMAEDQDPVVRRCGEQVLAVLGDAVPPDTREFGDRFTAIPDSGIVELNCSTCPGPETDTWKVGYHPSLDVLIEQARAHNLAEHGGPRDD